MFLFTVSFISLLLHAQIAPFNLTVDYQKQRAYHGIDETNECRFEEPELTRKSIAKWPKDCAYVFGVITFNENFDVPIDELKTIWENLYQFYGDFRVVNTNFKNLEFLRQFWFFATCSPIGTYIVNNSQLENVTPLANIYSTIDVFDKCVFQIANNPKLDATPVCKLPSFGDILGADLSFGVSENKVDCGCNGHLTPANRHLKTFKNCKKMVGKLVISGFQDDKDGIPSLSKIKVFQGDLEVFNTTLKSLSFLDNVTLIKTRTNRSISRINIDIHDNPEMIRFGMSNLKKCKNLMWPLDNLNVNFKNLHRNFCLTIEEMTAFLDMKVKFINVEAGYCNLNMSTVPLQNAKLCVFVSMSELDTGCVHLFGNLLIDSGDEEHVGKLDNVSYILGTLTVQNTDLFSLNFLNNLKSIANLDESLPVMRILSNGNLRTMKFENIRVLVSRSHAMNRVIVMNNHPELLDKVMDCLKFQFYTQTNVSINAGPCKSIDNDLRERPTEDPAFDFDFDTVDYSHEGYYTWYGTYDGPFNVPQETINEIVDYFAYDWKDVNDTTALVALLINIFHLIVLLQRTLRINFIFILMIAICLYDITYATTFIIEYLLQNGYFYSQYRSIPPGYHLTFSRLSGPIQEFCRKSAAILAFLMVLVRTLSVMMPTNRVLMSVTKPRWALLTICAVFVLQGSFDATTYLMCEEDAIGTMGAFDTWNMYSSYYVQCIAYEKEKGDTDILRKLMFIDGNFTVFLAFFYLLVTILLINQLRIARNRRKLLHIEKKSWESTSLLVTVMAITFFVSEVAYGCFFVLQQYFHKKFPDLAELVDQGQGVLWTMVTVNSTIHCLICFLLSSQYRSAIWSWFCCFSRIKKMTICKTKVEVGREQSNLW